MNWIDQPVMRRVETGAYYFGRLIKLLAKDRGGEGKRCARCIKSFSGVVVQEWSSFATDASTLSCRRFALSCTVFILGADGLEQIIL